MRCHRNRYDTEGVRPQREAARECTARSCLNVPIQLHRIITFVFMPRGLMYHLDATYILFLCQEV
jgi:hypothetical protein